MPSCSSKLHNIIALIAVTLTWRVTEGEYTPFRKMAGKYLPNNVRETFKVTDELHCALYCIQKKWCESVNFKAADVEEESLCDLNNGKDVRTKDDNGVLKNSPEYVYLEIIKKTTKKTVDDRKEETNKKTENRTSYVASTCKELLERDSLSKSGTYELKENKTSVHNGDDEEKFYKVYCHMETLGDCGRGGWTLVMKMSGNKRTFEYDSSKWTNKEVYNVDGGLANFSNIETLLESYWNVPFTMICLGMQYNDEKRWMKFAHNGSSLYDVIADNKQQTTTLARDKWLGLINNARLQSNCNKNGFNVGKSNVKARIGIVADDGDQCNNYNSIIGFGLDKLRSAQGSSRTIACGSAYLKIQNPNSTRLDLFLSSELIVKYGQILLTFNSCWPCK